MLAYLINYAALLWHAIGRRDLILREIVSVTSHKSNNSTSCENESINNFQLCKKVELLKKCQLLTVACIVNAG